MKVYLKKVSLIVLALVSFITTYSKADDGYRLWLRYDRIAENGLVAQYKGHTTELIIEHTDPVITAAMEELQEGLNGMLGKKITVKERVSKDGAIIIGTPEGSSIIRQMVSRTDIRLMGNEGYIIRSIVHNNHPVTVIAANRPEGVLYGAFHFLRLIQTRKPIDSLSIIEAPRIDKRLLNHWDNLNGSVERGYAGNSIWKWGELPEKVDNRYKDYARANASIGVNGTALNNVNSQAEILTAKYIEKAAKIADVLRPYGIHVYFSVKFTAPVEIGGLTTSDPLDPGVQKWWMDKAMEIYKSIPDFGGFLVKAYSEGQPGPQKYGRTHADGANMLAKALAPYGGIVMWRSFVYDLSIDSDRTKCAYLEFVPLDGKFMENVLVQTKNGPVDFQPREPFNPLFGAMPKTPLMMELQITQEYTGQARHLVYLAPQWKEVLDSDTYANGKDTTVAKIIDGSAEGHTLSGIAGVSGIGTDRNWSGHLFSQANWHAFGRLAWNPSLTSADIADEWIRMTWSNDPGIINTISKIMAGSWEACVEYMTPLGLHHLMAEGHHYGPGPDHVNPVRDDWSSTYYHKADQFGIGFNRSSTGTNGVGQYAKPLRELWDSPNTCPDKYLLWFHHLPWTYSMPSGMTLWEELQFRYNRGVDDVTAMKGAWVSLEGKIDTERFLHVRERLDMQLENAQEWRDVCIKYFAGFIEAEEAGFNHFIRAEGDKLMDGDREYRFISFNIPNLHMIEDQMPFNEMNPWRLPDTYELDDALETVAQMGGKAVRIYAITVRRADDPPGTPKHVLGPGEFNEEAFKALDNMMAIAAKHGIRVIIPLMDNWPWMGGREEYAGFRGKGKDAFWTDPELRADFKKTINFIINRTNTVTGIKYCDDMAILAWETGNELTSTPEWVSDIAAYIRGLDKNHLIIDGFHSNMLRESSLNDPNISLVTTHHYEQDPALMARNIHANMDMARGKKPYFVGEFGFISTAGLEAAIQAIIDSGTSGGLSWSLRFHSRDGGFYWHSEMLGLGLYKAFHWPGYDSGKDYDEKNVMKMMREKAFEIRNEKLPPILSPKTPVLMTITSPASINWQGSTGASGYDIQRREVPKGVWINIETDISDAEEAYRPLYADTKTMTGKSYEYRVRAKNSAGESKWSDPQGPINGIGGIISDPMMRIAQIFTSGGMLEFKVKNSRQAKEDLYRLSGEKDAFIVYHLDDPFDQFQIDCFFPGEVSAPKIEISKDGINYTELTCASHNYFVEDKAYSYYKPVRYMYKEQGLDAKYLKITWNGSMQIAHTKVGP